MTLNFQRFILFAVVLGGLLSCCGASVAAPVRIAGIVLNATKMQPASGSALTLLRPSEDPSQEVVIARTKTDSNGRFDFGPRELPKDDLLLVRAEWQGVPYLAAAFDGAARLKDMGVTVKPNQVQVMVYDGSSKSPQLKFMVHHLAISTAPNGLKCVQRVVVRNPSNATFTGIGPSKGTILLDIPAAAREVKIDPKITNAKLVKTTHGYTVSMPILPDAYTDRSPVAGSNALIIEYFMDWPSWLPWARTLDLSLKVQYPTNYFFVNRTPEDQILQVKAPQLSPDQVQALPIGGESQERIVNSIGFPMSPQAALEPNTTLSIQVSKPVNSLFWAFLLFLVVLCLGVPFALLGSRKNGPEAAEEPAEKTWEPADNASVYGGTFAPGSNGALGVVPPAAGALIENIARLDAQRERGEVAEEPYRAQRALWKKELIGLLSSVPNDDK